MSLRAGVVISLVAVALVAPAAAQAEPAWTCSAGAGWVAAGGDRASAPGVGGAPCPVAGGPAAPAAGPAGSVTAAGARAEVDGGAPSQTIDTRRPTAAFSAEDLTIRNADGSLVVAASGLRAKAAGSCDGSRRPAFAFSVTPGAVTLNGRPIDASREYEEPGLGVNGAPLFGRIRIAFGDLAATGNASAVSQGLVRRALHVTVTDRDGSVVFEAVGGEVGVGRDGAVCDPPPACPAGQRQDGARCVDLAVTPVTPVLPPAPALPAPPTTGSPRPGCRDAGARAGQVSIARLSAATLCVLNEVRRRRKLRRLRPNPALALAAAAHARDMVRRRFFAHDAPGGLRFTDRIFRSGYLRRYGRWQVGENLGWGWGPGGSPRAIVAAWMRSARHRRNVLNPAFRDAGLAIRRGSPRKRSRRGAVVYVLELGAFSPSAPA